MSGSEHDCAKYYLQIRLDMSTDYSPSTALVCAVTAPTLASPGRQRDAESPTLSLSLSWSEDHWCCYLSPALLTQLSLLSPQKLFYNS